MRARILTWVAVIVLSMTLGAAAVVGIDQLKSDNGTTAVITQSVPSTSTGVSNTTGAEDLSDLYAKVRPSIVTVEGSSRTSGGLGSGIILDKQGHILTNNHVVSGFSALDVRFAEGDSYVAKVVGTDPGNDLAVVQVQNAPSDLLVPAVLGDSDKI
jgi:putative serine protease PepD